jgi:hypothetical protein
VLIRCCAAAHSRAAARLHVRGPCCIRCRSRASPARRRSAGWSRTARPDIVAGYITPFAGTDRRDDHVLLVVLFVIVGDFIDAVPAIIIFMPIITS